MKVFHINMLLEKGGSAIFMNNLCRAQNNTFKVESKVFGLKKDIIGFNFDNNYTFLPYLNYITHLIWGKDKFTVFKSYLIEKIKESDIIHLHVIHTYSFDFKFLFSLIKKEKKSIVVTLHDKWFFTGRCAIPINCLTHKRLCDSCFTKEVYPKSYSNNTHKSLIEKLKIYEDFGEKIIFVSPSSWLKNSILEIFPNIKIYHVPNGIRIDDKLDFFNYNKSNNFIFITTDFKDSNKVNFDFLNKIINSGKKITIIGKNQPNWIDNNNVNSINYNLPNKEIFKYLSRANCFLILSKFENFPTILIEALVAGCCVLSSKNNGSVEILKHFNYGVDYFFIEDISLSQIEFFLYLNSDLHYSNARRTLAKQLFNIDLTAERYLNLYNTF